MSAGRARDFPQSLPLAVNRGPLYLLGPGESSETPVVSQMADFILLARLPRLLLLASRAGTLIMGQTIVVEGGTTIAP